MSWKSATNVLLVLECVAVFSRVGNLEFFMDPEMEVIIREVVLKGLMPTCFVP